MLALRFAKTHRWALAVMGNLLLVSITSCFRIVNFTTSGVVPAAEGYIKIARDDNRNYTIDVHVKRLAEPSRLKPPKQFYLVWMESKSNGIKNLGRLDSSTGLFSSHLRALLHAVTPFKPERVFVTAEDQPNITYPGTQVVLSTKTFK